jgi:RES domain-containing protein
VSRRTFWRLSPQRDRRLAFRGSRQPGRWHGRNSHPVYAAESVSLAALERLVYAELDIERGEFLPHHLFRIEIPADVELETLEANALPPGWEAMRAPRDPAAALTQLQKLGDLWYHQQRTVGLMVPSAHVPEEFDLLLNARHGAFRRLAIARERVFLYDPRLAARRRLRRTPNR